MTNYLLGAMGKSVLFRVSRTCI